MKNFIYKGIINFFTHSITNKQKKDNLRKLFFDGYDEFYDSLIRQYHGNMKYNVTTFYYKNNEIPLFQHPHNCGFSTNRMTERSLELAIVFEWLKETSGEIFEIGATTPYYFPRAVNYVCDPFDSHKAVTHKCSMFDLDLTDKNILSISTIEHIGLGECGLAIIHNETAVLAFEKIIKESNKCLITFPTGYNKELDKYFSEYTNFNNDNITITLYERNINDNIWRIQNNLTKTKEINYGPYTANGLIIIEKK